MSHIKLGMKILKIEEYDKVNLEANFGKRRRS